VLWKARGEPRHPRDVARLFSHLAHTSGEDVIDLSRVDVDTIQEATDGLREQFDRVQTGQGSPRLALGERRPDRIHDHGVNHHLSFDLESILGDRLRVLSPVAKSRFR